MSLFMHKVPVKAFRQFVLALSLVVAAHSTAWTADAPQTPAEKHHSKECWSAAAAQEGAVFSYPLRIFAAPDADIMAVNVDKDKWSALPQSDRITLLSDLACSYAGGRMQPDQWQPFGVVDPATNKTIETFTVNQLFPKEAYR
ncbi:hypothetical protein [Rhizobium sp. WW_1]|uniref:hypothetical protein n=2 Tax=unclassified Rhizobium TaxID=2613769 RepID=UPI000FF63115|nr:hypothetical protein [Rhizobium sp. WW_1]RKD36092.1 hypothetical protein BJ928_12570 [Rhizobium sp. WW_1]